MVTQIGSLDKVISITEEEFKLLLRYFEKKKAFVRNAKENS
jgi:hypothetical protein